MCRHDSLPKTILPARVTMEGGHRRGRPRKHGRTTAAEVYRPVTLVTAAHCSRQRRWAAINHMQKQKRVCRSTAATVERCGHLVSLVSQLIRPAMYTLTSPKRICGHNFTFALQTNGDTVTADIPKVVPSDITSFVNFTGCRSRNSLNTNLHH